MTELLGLTLSEALDAIRTEGQPEPRVTRMEPEKYSEGTERVVRVRPGEILVARFRDAVDS